MAGRSGSRARTGPSMADVAALAGVSSQTVSRVSMGLDNVRPETRDRVRTAMEQLGYAPNSAARALRYGSFGTIGMIAHRLARIYKPELEMQRKADAGEAWALVAKQDTENVNLYIAPALSGYWKM